MKKNKQTLNDDFATTTQLSGPRTGTTGKPTIVSAFSSAENLELSDPSEVNPIVENNDSDEHAII